MFDFYNMNMSVLNFLLKYLKYSKTSLNSQRAFSFTELFSEMPNHSCQFSLVWSELLGSPFGNGLGHGKSSPLTYLIFYKICDLILQSV